MPKPHIYNKSIFISYSRKNRERCDELASHLRNAGYRPWYDKQLDAGDKWWQRICEEIEKCQIFLILLEPEISNSLYCAGECDYASTLGRHIVPAMIVDSDNALPEWIAERHVHELTDSSCLEQHMRLMGALNKLPLLESPDNDNNSLPRPACPKTPQEQLNEDYRAQLRHLIGLIRTDLPPHEQLGICIAVEELLIKGCRWSYCKTLIEQLRNVTGLTYPAGKRLDNIESQYAGYEKNGLESQTSAPATTMGLDRVESKVDLMLSNMLKIPAGTFQMGSATEGRANEDPQHQVTISAFEMSKTPITNEQYAAFLNTQMAESADKKHLFDSKNDYKNSMIVATPSGYKVEQGFNKHPVINVSWYGAEAYARWLAESTSKHFDLPSEAEWEYACRAGSNINCYDYSVQ